MVNFSRKTSFYTQQDKSQNPPVSSLKVKDENIYNGFAAAHRKTKYSIQLLSIHRKLLLKACQRVPYLYFVRTCSRHRSNHPFVILILILFFIYMED